MTQIVVKAIDNVTCWKKMLDRIQPFDLNLNVNTDTDYIPNYIIYKVK